MVSWLVVFPARGDIAEIRESLRRGQLPSALAACERELAAHPDDYQALTLKGIALQLSGRPAEGLVPLRKAIRLQPHYLPALETAGQIEYQTGDPNCKDTLRKILAVQPKNAVAHAMLGVIAVERRECAGAVKEFTAAGPTVNENPITLWQYGYCLFQIHRAGDAAAAFERLLKVRENDAVRFNLGLAQQEARQYTAAAQTLEPLATRPVPDSDALNLLAAAYEGSGNTPDSTLTLRRAIDLYPREEKHYLDLASVCMEHSALELGVEILEIGARNIPRSAGIHAVLGGFYIRVGRTAKAEQEFREAETLAPETGFGSVGLGLALLQANDIDGSIAHLRQQYQRDKNNPKLNYLLASALLQKGAQPGQPDFAEIPELLKRSVARQPRDATAHALLGKVYGLQSEWPSAIRELEVALKLNPNDRTAVYQLMLAYGNMGQADKAKALQPRVRELLDAEHAQENEKSRYRLLRAAPDRRPQP
ncbi:MAG: tetratricopeptide repeat protein [Bryobacteraceae bacterium]